MNEMSRRDHAAMASNFAALPLGEQLILWGLRMWVKAYTQGENIQDTLRNGFKLAGAPAAHPALDAMMTVFSTVGRGAMDIRCPQCTDISADEHRILGAIAACQSTLDSHAGDAFLDCWMPPTALRVVREPIHQLAMALREARLMVRPRPWALHAPRTEEVCEVDVEPTATVH